MNYYFIYYKCKRYSRRDVNPLSFASAYTLNEMDCQGITNKHPLQFQIDCNKKYGEEHEQNGYLVKEEYYILNWHELTKEEYKKYKGWIG